MVVRVQKGDSWQSIAGEWQVTVEALQKANNYNGALREGMRLWIDGRRYCVAMPGDGWDRIAARYGVDTDALRRCNSGTLYPGKRVNLPYAEENALT